MELLVLVKEILELDDMDERVLLYLKEINDIREQLNIDPDEILELVKLSLKENSILGQIVSMSVNKNYYFK